MFQFTLSDGALVGLRAAAAHVMRVSRPGEPPSYVVGFALLDADDSDVVRLIGTVAERVAAVVAA
jgi:hypothetical protein